MSMLMADERTETQIRQWRCPHCGARLFDALLELHDGEIISVRCHGCRRIVTFVAVAD